MVPECVQAATCRLPRDGLLHGLALTGPVYSEAGAGTIPYRGLLGFMLPGNRRLYEMSRPGVAVARFLSVLVLDNTSWASSGVCFDKANRPSRGVKEAPRGLQFWAVRQHDGGMARGKLALRGR